MAHLGSTFGNAHDKNVKLASVRAASSVAAAVAVVFCTSSIYASQLSLAELFCNVFLLFTLLQCSCVCGRFAASYLHV